MAGGAAKPQAGHVPAGFFRNVVSAPFKGTNGIVYVLPETRPARSVFASYDVDDRVPEPSLGPLR